MLTCLEVTAALRYSMKKNNLFICVCCLPKGDCATVSVWDEMPINPSENQRFVL